MAGSLSGWLVRLITEEQAAKEEPIASIDGRFQHPICTHALTIRCATYALELSPFCGNGFMHHHIFEHLPWCENQVPVDEDISLRPA